MSKEMIIKSPFIPSTSHRPFSKGEIFPLYQEGQGCVIVPIMRLSLFYHPASPPFECRQTLSSTLLPCPVFGEYYNHL